ncbi:MAG: hypothetical protein RMK16_02000 [Acidobacteriota bacterium]|nr:hypothetical protein [Acidobacteriota bacterium]
MPWRAKVMIFEPLEAYEELEGELSFFLGAFGQTMGESLWCFWFRAIYLYG